MAIFGKIFLKKGAQKVGSYCNWGGLGEHGCGCSVFASKKNFGVLTQKLRFLIKKKTTPKHRGFGEGGVLSEITRFRQVKRRQEHKNWGITKF